MEPGSSHFAGISSVGRYPSPAESAGDRARVNAHYGVAKSQRELGRTAGDAGHPLDHAETLQQLC